MEGDLSSTHGGPHDEGNARSNSGQGGPRDEMLRRAAELTDKLRHYKENNLPEGKWQEVMALMAALESTVVHIGADSGCAVQIKSSVLSAQSTSPPRVVVAPSSVPSARSPLSQLSRSVLLPSPSWSDRVLSTSPPTVPAAARRSSPESRRLSEEAGLDRRLAELEDLARRQQGELDALEARPERLEAVTQQLTQELRRKVAQISIMEDELRVLKDTVTDLRGRPNQAAGEVITLDRVAMQSSGQILRVGDLPHRLAAAHRSADTVVLTYRELPAPVPPAAVPRESARGSARSRSPSETTRVVRQMPWHPVPPAAMAPPSVSVCPTPPVPPRVLQTQQVIGWTPVAWRPVVQCRVRSLSAGAVCRRQSR